MHLSITLYQESSQYLEEEEEEEIILPCYLLLKCLNQPRKKGGRVFVS
jgi:hypothetical protein